MRELLEEVVLEDPGPVEPEPVGQRDELEAFVEELAVGAGGPRPGSWWPSSRPKRIPPEGTPIGSAGS